MQRLLVWLVLVLFVAVGGLVIAVIDARREIGYAASRQATPARPAAPEPDPAAAEREAARQRELQRLRDEVAGLRRELRERPVAPSPAPGGGGAGEGGDAPVYVQPGTRPRDANGELLVTDEDVAYFLKVQERADRQRRVDGMVRGVMLRIDRIAARGEIQPLPDDRRREVETVLRKYVLAGDELSGRYLRSPDEETRGLTAEQRRAELGAQRSQLVAAAQKELEPILGVADAAKIAEESLQRPWGLRSERRLGGR
jgi:hypothetical protein